MRRLPGWRPITALGLVLALAGSALVAVGFFCASFLALLAAIGGSASVVGAFGVWAVWAPMGYGAQLALLGCGISVLSIGGHWFIGRVRSCPLWRSAR